MEEEIVEISENLKHKFIISTLSTIFIVDYLDGRFVIERTFQNNIAGSEEFEKAKSLLDTEDKVKKYIGLE